MKHGTGHGIERRRNDDANLFLAFCPERLIYGGGWGEGSTGESYRASYERVRSYLTGLSATDQAKVLGGNAAKLFGFPVTV